MKTTWLALISVTLEPARFAKKRSASGGIVSSWVATTNQLGLFLHAALLIGVPKVANPFGTCESYMNAAFSALKSAQKPPWNLALSYQKNPFSGAPTPELGA